MQIHRARDYDKISVPELKIEISSAGGSARNGFRMLHQIEMYEGITHGIVTSTAQSMALVLLQGCTKRFALSTATFMVHYPDITTPLWMFDDPERLKKRLQISKSFQRKQESIFLRTTKLSIGELRLMMKRAEKFSAEDAKSMGFIDEII